MNWFKKLTGFINFLGFARSRTPNPPPVPPKPAEPFPGYDPGERHVVEVYDDRGAQEYLYFGAWIEVVSTNVAAIQYLIEENRLIVRFNNTYVYEYTNIPIELAYDFFVAISKGKWVWDNLRTTRRWYQFLYSLNGRVPVRMEDPAAGSVKAALGSTMILGRDPFAHTKSAKRVKKRYAGLMEQYRKSPKSLFHKPRSYQFLHRKRPKAGLEKIRQIIRGG